LRTLKPGISGSLISYFNFTCRPKANNRSNSHY